MAVRVNPDNASRTLPLEQIISIALLTPMGDPTTANCVWGAPLLIWGSPGIGKSARVNAASEASGLHMEAVFSAGHHPEDFTGIPVRKDAGGLHRVCALEEVNRLVDLGKGVLCLEEISCAPPAVQAALLKVVLNRFIGDTILPNGVRIVSAANPPEEAAGGWELEPPLANRFIHIEEQPPSANDWGEWLLNGDNLAVTDYRTGEATVTKNWGSEWPRIKGLLYGFARRRPALLYNLPVEGDKARGRAWPSPRSWVTAGRLAATCNALGLNLSDQLDMIQAAVGAGAASEWMTWITEANLPSPEHMLRNGWDPNPTRLDQALAAYGSVAMYVTSQSDQKLRREYAGQAWNLFGTAMKANMPDIVVPAARLFVNNGLGLSAGGDLGKAAKPVMAKLGMGGFTQLAVQQK